MPLSLRISAAILLRSNSEREAKITRAPFRANSRAVDAPMPREAPVTRMRLPLIFVFIAPHSLLLKNVTVFETHDRFHAVDQLFVVGRKKKRHLPLLIQLVHEIDDLVSR